MFPKNCLKNNCDIKYAALANNELLQKGSKVDSTKLFFSWESLHARLNSRYNGGSYKKKKQKKIKAYRKSV